MTLTRLSLRNFQKHSKEAFDLDPLITVFVGPTRSGKSSAIKGLRWVCFNRPSGDSFVKRGTKASIAVLDIDGKRLKRKKGKGANLYSIDGKEFHALGAGGMPEEVASLLNLGPENFQMQHDPLFWVNLTPGELAREMNKVVNLDVIDRVLGSMASSLRSAKSRVDITEERVDSAKKTVDSLGWVEQAQKDAKELECLENDIAFISSTIDAMTSAAEDASRLASTYQSVTEASVDAAKLVSLCDDIIEISETIENMEESCERIEKTVKEIKSLREKQEKARKEIEEAMKGKCPLCHAPLR